MRITATTTIKVFKAGKDSVENMELKGYQLIKELFVDSSGFGSDSEPALTAFNFEREVIALCKQYGSLTAKITKAGQFQVYVGLFKKVGKATSKKLAGNLYEVNNDKEHFIKFYNTKILSFIGDHVVINTDGYETATTKKHINRYLPKGVYIYQKAGIWYVKDSRDNTKKDFFDGITVAN